MDMRASASYPSANGVGPDLNASAQEELLAEDDGKAAADPYTYERPLEAINRYSRIYEAAPLPTTKADRRVSRLPPGVALLDPFGYGLNPDISPYDSAAIYSNGSRSTTGSGSGSLSPSGRSPYPSSSSMSAMSGGSLSSMGQPSSSAATSPLPWTGPADQNDPRRASAGDLTPTWQSSTTRSPRFPGMGRSKLSGEIEVDTASQVESSAPPSPAAAGPNVIPTDHDYTNSRLFQRTQKAQKALEKERAKGRLNPAFDQGPGRENRRSASAMSFLSDAGSTNTKSKSRGSLGWFRSASEVALPLAELVPPSPALPSSQSVSDLGRPRFRGGGDRSAASSSSSVPLEHRAPPPAPAPLPLPGSSSYQSFAPIPPPTPSPTPPTPETAKTRRTRTRTSSANSSRSQSQAAGVRSTLPAPTLPPSPPLDSTWTSVPPPPVPKETYGQLDGYSRFDQPQPSSAPPTTTSTHYASRALPFPTDPPTPPSSESDAPLPITPTTWHPSEHGHSLPPGAGPPTVQPNQANNPSNGFYPHSNGDEAGRKSKASLPSFFGVGVNGNKETRRAFAASAPVPYDGSSSRAPEDLQAPSSKPAKAPSGSFFGRAKRSLATPNEPLRATVAPPPPTPSKLSKGKGSFFSTAFGRNKSGSNGDGGIDVKHKALPPMPMPAALRSGGPPARQPQLVSAGQ
ncbi:hypothetical protein RQP46_002981 [Phenoliferia psychrophenolica]